MFEANCLDSAESLTSYRDAFEVLWDDVLSNLSTDIDNISQTLERELILRRFNRSATGMAVGVGSQLSQIIGIRQKMNTETGVKQDLHDLMPNFHEGVVEAFAHYPIAQHFGITVKDAMSLPLDHWYRIRKSAKKLAEHKSPDIQSQLMTIIKDMMQARQITGD